MGEGKRQINTGAEFPIRRSWGILIRQLTQKHILTKTRNLSGKSITLHNYTG